MSDATINALVAEHVLGLRLIERPSVSGHLVVRAWVGEGWTGPTGDEPPDACNDGYVMLRVIEAMRSRFLANVATSEGVVEHGYLFSAGGEQVSFYGHPSRSRGVVPWSGIARDLPSAVALAALKALGVEVAP